ncbi:MAG TPA: class I SAM-dependent methyltransferase [Holophagaceae bacterium]|nr:class I SAM-dependent methyltransferase [Holophagaceae bacterium]
MTIRTLDAQLAAVPPTASLGLEDPKWQELRGNFEDRAFLTLHYASELYTARLCLLLMGDLGWEPRLRAGATAAELAEGLPAQTALPLAWMLGFAAQQGLLARTGDRFHWIGEPDLDLAALRARCEAEAPGHAANFDLLDGVRRVIPPFFTEGKPGEKLVYDLSLFALWLAYFRNDNKAYGINNLLPLVALREGLPEGARVLELGAGAGSFAQLLAQDAAARGYLDRIREYRFTDIAPAFLRRAQREMKEKAPGLPLSFSHLDLNGDLDAQGVEDESLDAIVAVNVLHLAKDLPRDLAALRRKLAPGGRLVLGECMKSDLASPIFLEFIFNFMSAFRDVGLDPELRPAHGFLTPEIWERALRHAGFSKVESYPDIRGLMSRIPSFFVGAMAATR